MRVQAPSSSSKRSPWFFNVPGVKHRYTPSYLWVSNQFTSSRMECELCFHESTTKYDSRGPRNKHMDISFPVANHHLFIHDLYQEEGQKPAIGYAEKMPRGAGNSNKT